MSILRDIYMEKCAGIHKRADTGISSLAAMLVGGGIGALSGGDTEQALDRGAAGALIGAGVNFALNRLQGDRTLNGLHPQDRERVKAIHAKRV